MTEKERSQELLLLGASQKQFERMMDAVDGTLMISNGDDVKHVYSGELMSKLCRAIARTLEQERMLIMSRKVREPKTYAL